MKNQRLKQLTVSFLVVLSLFVSSVSACACVHDSAETENHCQPQLAQHAREPALNEHSHSDSAQKHSHKEAPSASEIVSASLSLGECCCIEPTQKVLAKSESIKIEKQTQAILFSNQFEIVFIQQTILVKSEFAAASFLTDHYHNLTPGRAPPRL